MLHSLGMSWLLLLVLLSFVDDAVDIIVPMLLVVMNNSISNVAVLSLSLLSCASVIPLMFNELQQEVQCHWS